MNFRSPRACIAACAALLYLSMLAPAAATNYRVFTNDRFGTRADVPADWIAQPPPDNDDGRRFRSPDGAAEIAVWGRLRIEDTVAAAVNATAAGSDGESVTYRALGPRSVTLSGFRDGKIFYRRSILSCRDQIWNEVEITYPAASKTAYDGIVDRVARSLRGSNPAFVNCR